MSISCREDHRTHATARYALISHLPTSPPSDSLEDAVDNNRRLVAHDDDPSSSTVRGKYLKQTEIHQFHLSNDKRHTFRCIAYACAEGIR